MSDPTEPASPAKPGSRCGTSGDRAGPPQFRVQFTSSGGCPLIVAIGEIDIFSAPLLRDAINSSMASQPDRLIVDLDRVPFIDSSGLSVLVGAMRLLPPGAFRVVTTQARVVRVFNLSGIDRILPVYPTVEAATNVQPAAPAD